MIVEDSVLSTMEKFSNFMEIRKILISKGIRFRTNSDTEAILEAYKYWGVKCLGFLKECLLCNMG